MALKNLKPRQQLIKDALDLAALNCGGKLKLCAAIDTTASWCYVSIHAGKISSLEVAKKLEILTNQQFLAKDLCPEIIERIEAVSTFIN